MFGTKDGPKLAEVPLEELVSKTLYDIAAGVVTAANETKDFKKKEIDAGSRGFKFSTHGSSVEFDVSVSARENREQGAGAKLVAVPFASAGGSTAYGSETSSVARVKFSVTIYEGRAS